MYNNSTIIDNLVFLAGESGWQPQVVRPFYYELEKGDRTLRIFQDGNDFSLICKNTDPRKFIQCSENSDTILSLPRITTIPVSLLYAILESYGIVSMLFLATSEGLIRSEAEAV